MPSLIRMPILEILFRQGKGVINFLKATVWWMLLL